MRKDGCCCVQLGKIMNEVDRGWRRPSLKRNGSQQRDGDIDPSVTFFSSQMCTQHTKGHTKQPACTYFRHTHTFMCECMK